ncbi:hypothetical protein VNO78_18035 [Psophocarpus tetragonolobus]|uniref:Uncharacterized protein n=1 Tax=Psophocarpus tetragonolobus TaxID=3891 RepID=A0AAN9SHM4_PSOTE
MKPEVCGGERCLGKESSRSLVGEKLHQVCKAAMVAIASERASNQSFRHHPAEDPIRTLMFLGSWKTTYSCPPATTASKSRSLIATLHNSSPLSTSATATTSPTATSSSRTSSSSTPSMTSRFRLRPLQQSYTLTS